MKKDTKPLNKILYFYLVAIVAFSMLPSMADGHKWDKSPNQVRNKPYIDSESRTIRDKDGRHLILHGVNVVYKIPPYIPGQTEFDSQSSLTDKDISDLRDWGFNFVRLGVMWEAVEKAPGQFDAAYLKEIDALVTKLGEAGIYVLIDAHQDVLARLVCGEGMPNFRAQEILKQQPHKRNGAPYCINEYVDWFAKPLLGLLGFCKSIQDYGWRVDSDGNPLIEDCQKVAFSDYYTTVESQTLFNAIYENENNAQDHFNDFWNFTSSKLASNPYVIGFDPLNEPFPNLLTSLSAWKRLLPQRFDEEQLDPLYTRLFKTYQENNPSTVDKNIMFFEAATFPDIVGAFWPYFPYDKRNGLVRSLGFTKPPGATVGSDAHVLNEHSYCCDLTMIDNSMCAETGEPREDMSVECDLWHDRRIRTRHDDAQRLGIPLMVSEFGACMDTEVCAREIRQVAAVCDEFLAGWAYWQFKPFKDLTTTAGNKSEGFYNLDGTLQKQKIAQLTRPFVRAAQGQITYMLTLPGQHFVTSIKLDTDIPGPTEVYMNQDYWFRASDGYQLNVWDEYEQTLVEGKDFVLQKEGAGLHKFTFQNRGLDGVTINISWARHY